MFATLAFLDAKVDMSQDLLAFVQRTKGSARLWCRFGLVTAFALLVTGCETVEKYSLTHRLWDNGDLRKWSEPAPTPNLAMFEATNGVDVLIQYDALSERHSTVKRQAYYLRQNESRIAAGKKPRLVSLAVADGLKPVVVLPAPVTATNLPPGITAYAVVTNEGRQFSLFRPMESDATFDLPVYAETYGTPTRLVLTPFAVAGDTVMVGAVAVVVGCFLWLEFQVSVH